MPPESEIHILSRIINIFTKNPLTRKQNILQGGIVTENKSSNNLAKFSLHPRNTNCHLSTRPSK